MSVDNLVVDVNKIKVKALNGSIWAIAEKFSLQIVQFIVGIVLARLLGPKEYGTIAIATIFTGISAAITDGGFEKTLIQKKDIESIQISTIFYINVMLGVIITSTLFALAPVIADYFKQENLAPVLRLVSFGVVLNACGQTQRALLIKELHFKKISYTQIISSLIGGVSGVILAYNNFGVWALVYSTLISQIIVTLSFWINSDWYPNFSFSYSSIKSVLPYGINILFSSILFFFIQQFNNFIIGKKYSETNLGLYNRGSRLPELTISIIESVILKMAFPVFAKLQDNLPELIKMLEKNIRLIAFIVFPMLIFLLANARDITILLFTTKWIGSVEFLELFCILRLIHPLIPIYRELILAKGNAKLLFRILVFTSFFEIVLVLLLSKYGITYIILASFVSIMVQYLIYTRMLSKMISVPVITQVKWLVPYILVAACMGLSLKATDIFLNIGVLKCNIFISLVIKFLIAASVYFLIGILLKIKEFFILKKLYLHLRNK